MAIDFKKILANDTTTPNNKGGALNLKKVLTPTATKSRIDFAKVLKIKPQTNTDNKPEVKPEQEKKSNQPTVKYLSKNVTGTGGAYYQQPDDVGKLIKPASRGYGSLQTKPGQDRDHAVAFALGGANKDENLRHIPESVNKSWGIKEAELSSKVSSGEMSVAQARQEDLAMKQKYQFEQEGINTDPYSATNLVGGLKEAITKPINATKQVIKELASKKPKSSEGKKSMTFNVGEGLTTKNTMPTGADVFKPGVYQKSFQETAQKPTSKVAPGPLVSTSEAKKRGENIETVPKSQLQGREYVQAPYYTATQGVKNQPETGVLPELSGLKFGQEGNNPLQVAGNIGKEAVQMIIGSPIKFIKSVEMQKKGQEGEVGVPKTAYQRFLFGDEPVKKLEDYSIYKYIKNTIENTGTKAGLPKNLASNASLLATGVIGAIIENPFLGVGGKAEKKVLKETIESSLRKEIEKDLGRALTRHEEVGLLTGELTGNIQNIIESKAREYETKNLTKGIDSFGFSPELENQYSRFKDLRLKNNELDQKIADVDQLKKFKSNLKPEVIDDILYSQDKSSDEVLDMFKERLASERLGNVRPVATKLKNPLKENFIKTELTPGSQKTVDAFSNSISQKEVAKINEKTFEIGTFGDNALERKINKSDRANPSELPDAINNIKKVYKASNEATNWRKDNLVWIAENNNKTYAIYTRLNKNGNEEIINFHLIPAQKKEAYINTLDSFGVPARTRTGMTDLEDLGPIRLADRNINKNSLPYNENKVNSNLPTIKTGEIYHGTSNELKTLKTDEEMYSPMNIYGQGFYTTDNLEIANGYSKKGNGSSNNVYKIKPNKDIKLYNIENSMDENLLAEINKSVNEGDEYVKGTTLRQVYDDIRDLSKAKEISADTAQEYFDTIKYNLEKQGYRGLEHTGGKLTGNEPHNVKIYWKPNEDLSFELKSSVVKPSEGLPVKELSPEVKQQIQATNLATKAKAEEKAALLSATDADKLSAVERSVNIQKKIKSGELTEEEANLLKNKEGIKKVNPYKQREGIAKTQTEEKFKKAQQQPWFKKAQEKLRQSFAPVKNLDQETQKIYKTWVKDKLVSRVLANEEMTKFPAKMTIDDIIKYQRGIKNEKTEAIKKYWDDLYHESRARGLNDLKYRENYFPGVYNNTPQEIHDAAIKKMIDLVDQRKLNTEEIRYIIAESKGMNPAEVDYDMIKKYLEGEMGLDKEVKNQLRRLKFNPDFVKEKIFKDYGEAMEYGLDPAYKTGGQYAAHSRHQLENAIADRNFVASSIEQGKFVPASMAPDDYMPVTLSISPKGYYTSPQNAEMLNKLFRDESKLTMSELTVKGGATISRAMQTLLLSAGIPFTNVNAFTISQALVRLTAGDLSVIPSLIRGNFNKATVKYFELNTGVIKEMAEEGINLRTITGDYKKLNQTLKDVKGWKEKIGYSFHKMTDEKTFSSTMPMFQIETYKQAQKKALLKGMAPKEAQKFAADVTKKSSGLILDMGRSPGTTDKLSALLFAPPYREGIINTLANTLKAGAEVITNVGGLRKPLTPELYKNRRLLGGMIVALNAQNLLNKKLNGNYMWDNPPGHEFDLQIPMKNGDNIFIGFMPGFLTVPRNIASAGIAISKGDLKTFGQKTGSLFSMLVKTTSEIVTNRNYFGNEIYKDTDSGPTKLKKIAEYVGVQNNHPYIKEVYNLILQKKPVYQSVSSMLELPLKFSSDEQIAQSKYYRDKELKAKRTAQNKANFKPKYEAIKALADSGKTEEADQQIKELFDKNPEEYKIFLSYFKAGQAKEKLKNKIKLYPIYEEIKNLVEQNKTEEADQKIVDLYNNQPEDYKLLESLLTDLKQ